MQKSIFALLLYFRKVPFQVSTVAVTPWHHLGYDILAHHTIWNQQEVQKIMPNDTVYISILRNPVDLFESLYSYAELGKVYNKSLEEFALADKESGPLSQRAFGHLGQNQMLYDFGMNISQFQNLKAINEKIHEIETKFDLIMIAERFDESMILLKHLLNWTTEDVNSLKQNARESGQRTKLSVKARNRLTDWLKGDQMLYNYFYEIFDNKVKNFGSGMMTKELSSLVSTREFMKNQCSISAKKSSNLQGVLKPYGKVIGYHTDLNNAECLGFATAENPFTDILRNIQRRRAKKHFYNLFNFKT